MNLAAYKFAARLCTLPCSHPLQKVVTRCRRVPRFHRSPIHHLMSAFKDLHEEWETISASKVNTARSMATLVFAMADSKKSAEQDVAKLPREDRYMYSDGSSFKANIGIRGGCVDAQTAPKGEVPQRA
ncbi:hypothetical protein EDD85DRAFT_386333 [Armillaria nabsnona]|nr:hypothetical protein EDD85DRAFT_386333 [Armillaria nabsnona]